MPRIVHTRGGCGARVPDRLPPIAPRLPLFHATGPGGASLCERAESFVAIARRFREQHGLPAFTIRPVLPALPWSTS